jgi:hypothetical protein
MTETIATSGRFCKCKNQEQLPLDNSLYANDSKRTLRLEKNMVMKFVRLSLAKAWNFGGIHVKHG